MHLLPYDSPDGYKLPMNPRLTENGLGINLFIKKYSGNNGLAKMRN
jgi:hypothetical protein